MPDKNPAVVHGYNAPMNTTDQCDQNTAWYAFNTETLKRWKCALTYLLDVTILQSMILYDINTGKEVSQYNFKLQLIKEMATDILRLKPATIDLALALRISGRHYPQLIVSAGKEASA